MNVAALYASIEDICFLYDDSVSLLLAHIVSLINMQYEWLLSVLQGYSGWVVA